LKRYKEDGHGGSVELLSRPESIDLENKDIIVVEDIADNGDTLNWLNNFLSLREGTPRSVKYALLCLRRRHPTYHFKVHYHCFTVGNDWLVGYGFDSEGLCREWPEIWGKQVT
jgi:hypoxanthine phosphoribosyltransferase